MDLEIQKELEGLQLDLKDQITGMMTIHFPGWPENAFRKFDGDAIRILTSWEISGTAIHEDPARSFPMAISLDDQSETVTFQFHQYQFNSPATGGAIRVVNSPGTGELMIRCLRDMTTNTPRRCDLKAGSMIYVKDSAPNP